jgi:hypothetical protein
MLWIGLLSFLVQTSALAADDDCERMTSTGSTRDCTYLEEMHECLDDANDSYDDCVEDASSQDGFFAEAVNRLGCEASSVVNIAACGLAVSMDWLI